MTQEQWKNRIKNKEIPIRLHIANHEIPIENISYIGEVCINKELIAGFTIYMLDGSKIEFYYNKYKLTPIIQITKNWLFKSETIVKDIQQYFDRNCETLQDVQNIQQDCVDNLMEYYRFKIKNYRLVNGQN